VSIYYCPHDSGSDLDSPAPNHTAPPRGSYVVNWGNVKYAHGSAGDRQRPVRASNGNRSTPRSTTFANITDGTSNTLLLSET